METTEELYYMLSEADGTIHISKKHKGYVVFAHGSKDEMDQLAALCVLAKDNKTLLTPGKGEAEASGDIIASIQTQFDFAQRVALALYRMRGNND